MKFLKKSFEIVKEVFKKYDLKITSRIMSIENKSSTFHFLDVEIILIKQLQLTG